MKVGSNYVGINHKREKARDDFQAELKKLKTKKSTNNPYGHERYILWTK